MCILRHNSTNARELPPLTSHDLLHLLDTQVVVQYHTKYVTVLVLPRAAQCGYKVAGIYEADVFDGVVLPCLGITTPSRQR